MSHIEEDEVEASRAPLMEHLVELRQRLLLVIAFLVVGFIGCFAFSTTLYEWLLVPYQEAAAVTREIGRAHV